jgi:NAD(P)-dependent dehydrogenase (short-subunit alcohol dehydrogenase family)
LAGDSGYARAKGAPAGFTNALAPGLGAGGIPIDHVQPGRRATNMNPPADGGLAQAASQASSRLAMATPRAREAPGSSATLPASLVVKSVCILIGWNFIQLKGFG